MGTPKKILICKIGALGDVVFTLPAVKTIKAVLPDAEITWLVGKSSSALLAANPDIHRLVVVDDKALFAGSAIQRMRVVREMRSQLSRYDLILVAHRGLSFSAALFGRGPIVQLSRLTSKVARFFARQVLVEPLSMHESLAIRKLVCEGLRLLNVECDGLPWRWNLSYLSDAPLGDLVLPDSFVCIHVGGGQNAGVEFTLKRWPHWPVLIKLLNANSEHVVLVGAPSEAMLAEEILEACREGVRSCVINHVGKTSLLQLAAVIAKADVFVGPDSGPLHLAEALAVPAIGLYGATSTVSWGLLNSTSRALSVNAPCSPCYKDDGQFPPCVFELRCMKQLSPEMVMTAVDELSRGKIISTIN